MGNIFTLLGVLEHPFPKGSKHIRSPDRSLYPEIDPQCFSHSFDLAVLSKIAPHLQAIARTPYLPGLLINNGTSF
jgi:choline dehydrogenase